MARLSTIELFKEEMKFSAGHFTIFSATERENLHGHNYQLYVAFTAQIGTEGLSFDYRFYKEKLYQLSQSIDETVLIPGNSPYLSITPTGRYHTIQFHDEELIFLNRDITILPVSNITVEELSHWFLSQILKEPQELKQNKVVEIHIKVFSGPGQSGSSTWKQQE